MRRKEGKKEQAILDAAVRVFSERGYHNAKIATIADRAGVATGSVYLYYRNKEALLLAIFDHIWGRLATGLAAAIKRTDLTPVQKLETAIDLMFELFILNPALATVFVNEQNFLIRNKKGSVMKQYDHYLDLAEEVIREGVRKKFFDPSLDLKLIRHFITGGLRSLLQQWTVQPSAFPLNRIRQHVKTFVKSGVLAR